jgi:hypothetical protein
MISRHKVGLKRNTNAPPLNVLLKRSGGAQNPPILRSQFNPYKTIELHVWDMIPNDNGGRNDAIEKLFKVEMDKIDKLTAFEVNRSTPQRYFETLLRRALKNKLPTDGDKWSLSALLVLILIFRLLIPRG